MARHVRAETNPPARPPRFRRAHHRAHGKHGSPRLGGEADLDLLVGVRSLAAARCCCVEPLKTSGYTYMPRYEAWLPGELFFRKGIPGPWTHHVHVMEPSSPRWGQFLLFRDYLRSNPEAAVAYADLKRRLAAAHGDDIAGYRNAKHAFVETAMTKARGEHDRDRDVTSSVKRVR